MIDFNKNPNFLIKKYLAGNCSEREKCIVENWYISIKGEDHHIEEDEMLNDLQELNKQLSSIPEKRGSHFYIYKVAACLIFLLLSVCLYYYQKNDSFKSAKNQIVTNDINPGGNMAFLSIDGGKSIPLDANQDEIITNSNGIRYKNGLIIHSAQLAQTATISTPVAGQYKIELPDGTIAWLNSLSKIRYPTKFQTEKRQIEVEGEIYLEVKPNPLAPFIVKTRDQTVVVLGTCFNINAYPDENQSIISLSEGSLKVINNINSKQVTLSPGQQAISANHRNIVVSNFNIEDVISWKDGLYVVNDETLSTFFRKIERWYDVTVEMNGHEEKSFSAIIPRDAKLSEVLRAIEGKTQVKFKIEGRRVMAI